MCRFHTFENFWSWAAIRPTLFYIFLNGGHNSKQKQALSQLCWMIWIYTIISKLSWMFFIYLLILDSIAFFSPFCIWYSALQTVLRGNFCKCVPCIFMFRYGICLHSEADKLTFENQKGLRRSTFWPQEGQENPKSRTKTKNVNLISPHYATGCFIEFCERVVFRWASLINCFFPLSLTDKLVVQWA